MRTLNSNEMLEKIEKVKLHEMETSLQINRDRNERKEKVTKYSGPSKNLKGGFLYPVERLEF